MDAGCASVDRISTLPLNLIEKILCLMPIRDTVRTSILSSTWRYKWGTIPQLAFDEEMFKGSSKYQTLQVIDKFHVMYQLLLMHRGPILDFSLSTLSMGVGNSFEIDQIISYLVRNNDVRQFKLETREHYKLPSLFFSLQRLTVLILKKCEIKLPSTFHGFSKLTHLHLKDVIIPFETLLLFISKCSPLSNLLLTFISIGQVDNEVTDVIDLFKLLPVVTFLSLTLVSFEPIVHSLPRRLPILLSHLQHFFFSLCFKSKKQLDLALLVMRSSATLKFITLVGGCSLCGHERVGCIEEDLSDVRLDNLCTLSFLNFSNLISEMDFLKYVLVTSPKLLKMHICLSEEIGSDGELKLLRSLLGFKRASLKVDVVVEHES